MDIGGLGSEWFQSASLQVFPIGYVGSANVISGVFQSASLQVFPIGQLWITFLPIFNILLNFLTALNGCKKVSISVLTG